MSTAPSPVDDLPTHGGDLSVHVDNIPLESSDTWGAEGLTSDSPPEGDGSTYSSLALNHSNRTSNSQDQVAESDSSSLSQSEPSSGSHTPSSEVSLSKKKSFGKFFAKWDRHHSDSPDGSKDSFQLGSTSAPTIGSQNLSTRPPQLPPKNPAEEKKHLQMHQNLMKQTEERDRRKAEAEQRKKERREQQMIRNAAAWQNEIIPNWEEKSDVKRIIELAEEGIPPKFRGRVWALSLGNDLNITEELFTICLERARAALTIQKAKNASIFSTSPHEMLKHSNSNPYLRALGKEDTVELISTDLTRTFPSLGFFQVGGPYYEPLRNVLEAYVCYRPDIGYVQGMSFLAAMLLLNMDTFEAFRTLCNMLNRRCHMAFFQMDMKKIQGYKDTFKALLSEYLPAIYSHFESIGVEPELFIFDWFITLYTRSMTLEIASRIWDVYFLQGEIFLFKTALGILRTMEKRILGQTFDSVAFDLTHLPAMDENEFFANVEALQITEKRFNAILAKYVPRL